MTGTARVTFTIALLLTCTVAAQNRGPLDLANAVVRAGAHRIAYGSAPLQFGELRLPRTKAPHPVAIVVHGGCWLAQLGTMDKRAVAMDNMRPLAGQMFAALAAPYEAAAKAAGDRVQTTVLPGGRSFRVHRSPVGCLAAGARTHTPAPGHDPVVPPLLIVLVNGA